MGRQIKQVLITYITHRWVMAGIAAWLLLIVGPQILLLIPGRTSPSIHALPMINMWVCMPVFFLSLMLVPQLKAQFSHPRAVLTPSFVQPHLAVAACIILLLAFLYPTLVAWCCRLSPLGMVALASAIAAGIIWSSHLNRFWPMLIAMAVFYSPMTPAGAKWWLMDADFHWPLHLLIAFTAAGLIVGWFFRLSCLREEMDDYQTVVLWQAARKSGIEIGEQRRIVAEQLRRNKLASWISDTWLARLGGYHEGRPFAVARLLRFGFGQPAEINALFVALMFMAITFFMAKFSFAADAKTNSSTLFYMQMSSYMPGFAAGELLARRRPRIAAEMLLPLSRPRLINGLLGASIWNGAVFWLVMNAGLILVTALVANQLFTLRTTAMMLLLTFTGAFALAGLSMRTAVWPSAIKRMAVVLSAMLILQIPATAWSFGRERTGDTPYLVAAAVMIGIGAGLLYAAWRAWLKVELA